MRGLNLMDELKPIDHKLLGELLKNSNRSDRELAKILGVSQPTVTRKRANIEKNLTDGYTVIPKLNELGFEIVAFTFVKHHIKLARVQDREEAYGKVKEWMMKQPNVILAIEGQGMGWDGVLISFHKNYSDFTEFIKEHNNVFSDLLLDTQSFISSTSPKTTRKPFHLKYLASIV
jgi:DNA-binding Lrp family transcriptional regulator